MYLLGHTLTEDCGRVSWFNLKEEKRRVAQSTRNHISFEASRCIQRQRGAAAAQRLRRILADSVNGDDCMNTTGWAGPRTGAGCR